MFANLLPLCLLLGVAKANYASVDAKSLVVIDDLSDERHFYLDDQQCTATISQDLLCDYLNPLGVFVEMWDEVGHAGIHIEDDLKEVFLARIRDGSGRCPGRAKVDVKLLCDGPLLSQGSGERSRLASE